MTDNEMTREKTFSEELPYFKENIKEVFDDYDNPNGCEDPLYICVLRQSKRIVRKAEEEIKRQQTEIERLKDLVRENEGILPKYENLVKSEVVKEFADKAKEKMRDLARVDFQGDAYCLISESFFDNLVKEMGGEDNVSAL